MDINGFYSLVARGLVTQRKHGDLIMFKYRRKVFFENLWHVDSLLVESRGVVFHKDGEVVQRPIEKCFNVGENGTKMPAYAATYRKINGFMVAATHHNGENLVTTTGSFDSDFQVLAKEYVEEFCGIQLGRFPQITFTFEVCDPSDPHIVEEAKGLYLLAARWKDTGHYVPQSSLDSWVYAFPGVERPAKCDFDSTAKHEGFMFYDHITGAPLAKCKTKHYLTKKALMRVGKNQVKIMFKSPKQFKERLDEEFYQVYDRILDTFTEQEYAGLAEQERRAWIENNL